MTASQSPPAPRRWRINLWGLAAALLALAALAITLVRVKIRSGVTATAHGEQLALKLGCFSCHGMGGEAGIANPGSDDKTVPAWTGGTALMYILKPEELDEWLLDGFPKREANEDRSARTFTMPAYRGRMSAAEFSDLKIYLRAVMALDAPVDGDAKAGYEIARDAGCFGCHGPSGRGLRGNPGSLAGYIPAWEGPVFTDLAKDDGEIAEWIRTGTAKRMQHNRIAAYFMKRQLIPMPAYEKQLKQEEIQQIVAYIHWLRTPPPAP